MELWAGRELLGGVLGSPHSTETSFVKIVEVDGKSLYVQSSGLARIQTPVKRTLECFGHVGPLVYRGNCPKLLIKVKRKEIVLLFRNV